MVTTTEKKQEKFNEKETAKNNEKCIVLDVFSSGFYIVAAFVFLIILLPRITTAYDTAG